MNRTRTALAVHLVLVLLAISLSPSLVAQTDFSQLSGIVRDSSGAVVMGAQVLVRNESTALERRATTTESGYYVAPNIPPGTYSISVDSPGFKHFVATGKKVDASISASLDVVLELGAVSEVVEVLASSAALQTDTAVVGRTVETQQIQNLMLNGRNGIRLALLKAGVSSGDSLASFGFGLSSGGYSINGSRAQDNLITMDGAVATRTRANGTSIGVADVDTLAEVQVLTANFNAEYGRSGGGQIRMVTKSGTNELHGAAYDYFRNDKLDANTWARNRAGQDRETLRYNQFGYNASGPVFIPKFYDGRNKFFWLWAQEWVRFRRQETTIVTVPTEAFRQGDFSQLLGPNPFYTPRQLKDPDTGQPVPNNIIPVGQRSANGLALLSAYPLPTAGFLQGRSNYIQTRPSPEDQRKDTLALDYNLSDSRSLRYRRQNYYYLSTGAFRGGLPHGANISERPNITHSLSHTWTVSPTVINESMFSASADRVSIDLNREDALYQRSLYGINYPYIFPERKEIYDKIPTVVIPGLTDLDGSPYPSRSAGPIYQFQNSTTKVLDNHTIKFGARFDRQGQNDFDQINVSGVPGGTNNQNGRFAFSDNTLSGLGIANAAFGRATTYAEIGQRAYTPYRSHSFEWFFQDSWRATSKLSVEIGLRHTIVQPYYYSLWRNMAVFDVNSYDPNSPIVIDPKTGNILSGNRYNGVRIPGDGWTDAAYGRVGIADTGEFDHLFTGGSKTWGELQKFNFQPRLGLAYKLNDKTVVRVGGGKFYSRPGVADNIFLGGNPPFQPMVSIANANVDNPGSGEATGFPQFFMTSDPVAKIPSTWTWSATVQREVGAGTTVELSYVGRQGQNLERVRELNALQPGTKQANPTINENALRPYKGFAFINLGENAARSLYHGLQISVDRRFSKGLSFGGAYTYSNSEDDASDRRAALVNPFDARQSWGASNFNRKQVMVLNYIWEIPFFRNGNSLAGKTLGGWQISGVTQIQTGTPGSIGLSTDIAGIGSGNAFQPFNVVGDPVLSGGDRGWAGPDNTGASDKYWFRVKQDGKDIFVAPAPGTFAVSGWRGSYYNPGIQTWNISLTKSFQLTERQSVRFRSEFFNFPNRANWNSPGSNPNNSDTFGKITSKTDDRRQIQFSLRYEF